MVRRDDGSGTPTPTGGTLVYAGTDLRAVDTDVAPWTTYRYTLWGDDGAGGYLPPRSLRTTTGVQVVAGLAVKATSSSTALVSWQSPTDPGVAAVVVTRTDPRGATHSIYTGTDSSVTDTGLVPGEGYSYTVVAQDASGRRGPVSSGVGVTTHRTWTTTVVSPYAGWPGAMACATSTWCMAVDNMGSYQVMSGSTWSKAVHAFAASPDPESEAVVWSLTCPTAGRCLAIHGASIVEFVNGAWRPARAPSSGWTSVDCPSATYCLAIRRDGWSTTRVGTTWSTPVRIGSLRGVQWNDVACQAAGRCFAIATSTTTESNWRGTLLGSAWHTGYLGDMQQGNPFSISCSTTTCLALGERGARVTVAGTTWSSRLMVPTPVGNDTSQVSCGSATLCMAVNWNDVQRWSGSAVVERSRLSAGIGRMRAVSCPRTGGACFAVDDRGRFYRWTSTSHWRFVTTYDQTTGGVGRIGCRTATACYFVDRNGWLLAWNGTAWRRWGKYFSQPAIVECSGAGFCLAVDTVNKDYRVWANGSWGALKSMPLLAQDVSCASPTLCLAVDDQGRASRFTGTGWATPVAALPDSYGTGPRVSCAPGGPCMLLSSDGTYRRYVGSSLTSTQRLPTGFPAAGALLSCGAPSMCIAVVDAGNWAQWNGSTWTAHPVDFSAYRIGNISCLTAGYCLATHAYSNDYSTPTWIRGKWSDGDSYAPDGMPSAPECPTLGTCFIGGATTVSRSS
ncbi:fibronectin type III domain-containing protein [Terrabacter sp. NPDC080008]|uniref:fibronectin type III domain-containing protein n=1 Tax=Terrabacter sp. NPDC080008 TaxID=3155176 RepID=UPI00344C5E50